MSRFAFVSCVILAAGLCLAAAQAPPAAKPANRGPDIDFDYQTFVKEHLSLISSGEIEKAVGFLRERAKYPQQFPMIAENIKRQLAGFYGGVGEMDSHEVTGFKRLSSRIYQFHTMAYFEKATVRITYTFEHFRGDWKWITMGFQGNLDEVAKDVPLQMIDAK